MSLPPPPEAQSPNREPAASHSNRKQHPAGSAAILLMFSSLASGVLALIRIKYVNLLFGAGLAQDAYRAAFRLPDLINYFLIGGAASLSRIPLPNRSLHS